MEWCQVCGRRRGPGEYSCPACECSTYDDVVPPSAVAADPVPAPPLGGILGRAMSMPARYVLALHGRRGGGKSTVAFGAFERPHIVTSEMDSGRILEYLARIGARHGGMTALRFHDDDEGRRIDLGRIGDDVTELILDSASASPDPALAVAAVRRWVDERGGRAIVILHQNKDGEPAGTAHMLHACDGEAEILVEGGQRRLALHKHRGGDTRTIAFELGADGAKVRERPRYYSIEGRGTALRLVPYPSPESGPFAAYLRAVEASRRDEEAETLVLPPPPCAVAALRSDLYRGGWIEPADEDERRAFAAAAGVPYFSPLEDP